MTKTTRGSEWRKWDLHIHTPGSFYWIGNKKFQEMTPKEANEEMKVFIKNINESDVDVFCIMDYWNFNWYLALKDYIQQNPNELKKTVFPGIELRVECPVDYRLNLHCILSDKLSKQEINDFKSELCIRSIDRKLSDEALMQFAKSLDESKAKVHGFGNPENLDERKLLLLGSKTAEVTKESLDKAFHRIPKGAGYIILPYDTSDGISKLNWKSHPHDDNYFMQRAHIFEVREHSNIELISGQKNEKNRRYFDNFIKTLGGKAKPCISGSDAHEYSYYGKFPSNKITWIKADPTFEGLKQIIHEPSARVKIQPDEPDLKEETLVIDQVRFISKDDLFTPVPIVFNKNLNVIIGGKSSGKSILLYSIARTLLANRKLLKKKDPNTDKETYRYNSIIDNDDFNFEVKIGSGNTQSIKRADDEPSILPEIKYIPQNYLSKLVEPENKKEMNSENI